MPESTPASYLIPDIYEERNLISSVKFPNGNASELGQLTIAFKTAEVSNIDDLLTLRLLERTQLSSQTNSLRKNLLSGRMGYSFSDGVGLRDSYNKAALLIGVKYTERQSFDTFRNVIMDNFTEIALNGINNKDLKAAISKMEIHSREIIEYGCPIGFSLFLKSYNGFIKTGDPFKFLGSKKNVDILCKNIEKDDYLKEFVKKYFLNNEERCIIDFQYSKEVNERIIGIKSKNVKNQSHTNEKSKYIDNTKTALPLIDIHDAEEMTKSKDVIIFKENNTYVGLDEQFTGGVSYITISFDATLLDLEEISLLPLLSSCLTGCSNSYMSLQDLSNFTDQTCGNIFIRPEVFDQAESIDGFSIKLNFYLKCLETNYRDVIRLFKTLASGHLFLENEINSILNRVKSATELRLINNASITSSSLANSGLNYRYVVRDALTGYRQVQSLRKVRKYEISAVRDQLLKLARKLLSVEPVALFITSEKDHLKNTYNALNSYIKEHHTNLITPNRTFGGLIDDSAALVLPLRVNFNCKSWYYMPMSGIDSANIHAICNLISDKYLFKLLRSEGGAYGWHAKFTPQSGVMTLISTRDPNLDETLSVFDRFPTHFLETEIDSVDLEVSKVAALKQLDLSNSVEIRNRRRFFEIISGISFEMRESYRERIIATNLNDIKYTLEKFAEFKTGTGILTNETYASRSSYLPRNKIKIINDIVNSVK